MAWHGFRVPLARQGTRLYACMHACMHTLCLGETGRVSLALVVKRCLSWRAVESAHGDPSLPATRRAAGSSGRRRHFVCGVVGIFPQGAARGAHYTAPVGWRQRISLRNPGRAAGGAPQVGGRPHGGGPPTWKSTIWASDCDGFAMRPTHTDHAGSMHACQGPNGRCRHVWDA